MKQIDKLNEDFFDDFSGNELVDEPVDVLIDNSSYTYHIHFIIYMYPFIKNNYGRYCVYYFEEPEYKSIIESGFLSMKKSLEFALQAIPIVTDYSKPKFCSSSEKIIEAFPFMNNTQSNEFEINDNQFIILKTSINLSRRKNIKNLAKLFYSFCRLQNIYDKLLLTKMSVGYTSPQSHINIGIGFYKNNSYKKPKLCQLTSAGLELIKFLNSKDETDE